MQNLLCVREQMIHKAVLTKELIGNLNLKAGDVVFDGTLGAGGHSAAILEKIIPGGKLVSIDQDERAIENFKKKLTEGIYISGKRKVTSGPAPITSNANGEDISLSAFVPVFSGEKIVGYWSGVNDNFSSLDKIARGLVSCIREGRGADAVFVDLGFSSDQIEDKKRGFSFLKNGPASNASPAGSAASAAGWRSDAGWPLDMRYSPDLQKLTAADIVNEYPERKLAEIFRNYGEEKFAGRIAREILLHRNSGGQVRETGELVEIISKAIPEKYKRGKIHFATKVFQALRIETNNELENLKIFLEKAANLLKKNGRLAVISFHSLEDRIVKQFFRRESRDCVCPPKFPKCVCDHKARLKIITKKPITAGEEELKSNPRARSARLRVAQKI
jgi:16S rRNA (cytosine1402-N4)-methyltransferase